MATEAGAKPRTIYCPDPDCAVLGPHEGPHATRGFFQGRNYPTGEAWSDHTARLGA